MSSNEKVFVFLRRTDGETLEDFHSRYLQEHTKQILVQSGILRYTANLSLDIPEALTPQSGFGNAGDGVDAVDELWCKAEDVPFALYEQNFIVVGAYRIDERIIVDYKPDWPVGQRSLWLKRLAFLRRVEGMSHDEFGDYWQYRHGPIAAKTHRIAVKYVQNLITDTLTDGTKPWDGIVQMHFWSVREFVDGFFPEPDSREIIMKDVLKFIGDWGVARPAWLLSEYIMR